MRAVSLSFRPICCRGGLYNPGVDRHIHGRQQAFAQSIMKSRLSDRRHLGPLQYDAERGLVKGPDGAAGFQGAGPAQTVDRILGTMGQPLLLDKITEPAQGWGVR